MLGCTVHKNPPGQQGQGELKKDDRVHLELAQHGVTALPQVSQVQAPLVILEPLGQRQEGYRELNQAQGLTLSDSKVDG